MRPLEPLRARRSPANGAGRREGEECLARWGRLRRPRPLAGSPATEDAFGRRLRGALLELGPVFSAFGLYLASRIDLLAAADSLELAALPDGGGARGAARGGAGGGGGGGGAGAGARAGHRPRRLSRRWSRSPASSAS